jgi:hypothetical protein
MSTVTDAEINALLTDISKRLNIDVSTCDPELLNSLQVELRFERGKAMSRRYGLPHPDVYAAALNEVKAAI